MRYPDIAEEALECGCEVNPQSRVNVLYLHETSVIAGAENSLIQLVKNLDPAKFKPFFILPEEGPFAVQLRECGAEVGLIDFPKIRNGIGVIRAIKLIRRFILKNKIALVHSNSIRTHVYGLISGRLSGVPIVWHERNLIEREIIDPDRMLAFLPDAIICNSNAIAKRFIKYGRAPEKVHVIHNGVDVERFNPLVKGDEVRRKFGIGQEEIVIGIASRLNQNKGHETFLSAASKLLKEAPNGRPRLRFLIAGGAVFEEDKHRERYLQKLAEELNIADRVIFTGFVSDMPKIYAAIDIFVIASFAEPCGRVVAEAMACGRPVVGTGTGGTPEMVADGVTGLLVSPGDAAAMATAIRMLIEDKSKRLAMGREARVKAEKEFDINVHAKKTEALYSRILSKIKR